MNNRKLAKRIAQKHLRRRADVRPSLLEQDPKVQEKLRKKIRRKAQLLLSRSIQVKLRRAFTPRGYQFFEFYLKLRGIELGLPPDGDLFKQYKQIIRILLRLKSPVDGRKISPPILNKVLESQQDIGRYLRMLDTDRELGPIQWKRVAETYGPLVQLVARDKKIYLNMKVRGVARWTRFTKMRPRQEEIERLRDDNPEAYDAVMRKRALRENIDENIKRDIISQGLEYEKGFLMHRPVHMGVDPVTNEKTIFTMTGEVFSPDEFRDHVIEEREVRRKLAKAESAEFDVENLREFTSEQVDAAPGEMRWVSLSDDKAKQGKLTRLFKVKKIADPNNDWMMQDVIAEGRFKGIPLDDMVNSQGRMLEGTEYTYDPGSGERHGRPVKRDPALREPYVSLSDENPPRLYIQVAENPRDSKMVENLRRLAGWKLNPSNQWYKYKRDVIIPEPGLEMVQRWGTKKKEGENWDRDGYYFTAENFAMIRDAIGGMALSEGASKHLQDYFDQLTRAEQATKKENLAAYEAKNLGGFKDKIKLPGKDAFDLRLLTKQKEALAWLEANNDRGIVALDTGIGKCCRFDTLVVTDSGLVQIQDMNPGVTSPDTTTPVEGWSVVVNNKKLPVKSFYYGGEKPTIKVTSRYNFSVEGSLIHPLLVKSEDDTQWKKTSELQIGDYLCIDRSEDFFPEKEPDLPVVSYLSPWTREAPLPQKMSPNFARLLGYIVAEGWTNGSRSFSISQCPETNPDVRKDIEELLQSYFGISNIKPEKDIVVNSKHIMDFFSLLGVSGTISKDKTVPRCILEATKESVRQFLRGYIDAESNICDMGIEISSASQELSKTVQILLLRFGIVSRRRPKKVAGYEHTYWVTHIFGDDARSFAQKIGLVSKRKKEALLEVVEKPSNPNQDVVPHVSELMEEAHKVLLEGTTTTDFRDRFGNSLSNTLNHVRFGHRNATYRFLREVLSVAENLQVREETVFDRIQEIVDLNYFYDPIISLEESRSVVMDIEVDDPSHCFVGNGLVNHNTIAAVGMMQKLIRDGWAEEAAETNGRYLFVVPKAPLKGNVVSEVEKFLEPEAAENLTSRIDELTARQYSIALGKRKAKIKRGGRWVELDPWMPEDYIAIFFDEAHEYLTNPNSKTTRRTSELNHPRKICLTASPMQQEPMDTYVMSAVCNNVYLGTKTEEGLQNRKDMRAFKNRFCEEVGGRIMGVKDRAVIQRDLDTWVKRNCFYADKTNVDEYELPKLAVKDVTVTMGEKIEQEYQDTADKVRKVLKALTIKFRDKGLIEEVVDPDTGETKIRKYNPSQNPNIEKFGSRKLRPLFKKLTQLALKPETVIDGLSIEDNPKLNRASDLIQERMEVGSTSLLFTDDSKYPHQVAKFLSTKIPGVHASGVTSEIKFFKSGKELKSWTVKDSEGSYEHKLPFKARGYKLFGDRPAHKVYNKYWKKNEWSQFVLKAIIQANINQFNSLTLYGKTYQVGQNLQKFGTVIHLDRNSWNSENMKQRTARAWRQGQENPVTEFTLDLRYSDKKDENDTTLDEIRKYHQELEGSVFDRIIKQAQEFNLGEEWLEIEQKMASYLKTDEQTFDLMMSPYLDNV